MSTRKTTKIKRRSEWGTVRQLPSGRWQVRFHDDKGVLRPDSRTYATEQEARARLVQLRAQLAPEGTGYQPVEAGAVRFDVFADQWIKNRRVKGRPLKPGVADLYRHQLIKHVLPHLGALELRQITPEHVEVWHAKITDVGGAGSVGAPKVYRLVRAILNTATKRKHFAENPCQIDGAGQEHCAPRPDLTRADALKIADAVPARWRCVILTAMGCGLRFGELSALTRDDVDLQRGAIHVRRSAVQLRGRERGQNRYVSDPKTDAGRRTVHMPPSLVAKLDAHMAEFSAPGDDGWVFAGPKGGPLQAATFGARVWRPTVAALGLTGTHFHDLRATSATHAAEQGATVAELMRRLGHTTPDMAMRYQRAADHRDAEIARRMDAA